MAGGGEHVIGAAGIVACSNRRVLSQEYAPGVADGSQHTYGITGDDLQMLRCKGVGEVHSLINVIGY